MAVVAILPIHDLSHTAVHVLLNNVVSASDFLLLGFLQTLCVHTS